MMRSHHITKLDTACHLRCPPTFIQLLKVGHAFDRVVKIALILRRESSASTNENFSVECDLESLEREFLQEDKVVACCPCICDIGCPLPQVFWFQLRHLSTRRNNKR